MSERERERGREKEDLVEAGGELSDLPLDPLHQHVRRHLFRMFSVQCSVFSLECGMLRV